MPLKVWVGDFQKMVIAFVGNVGEGDKAREGEPPIDN